MGDAPTVEAITWIHDSLPTDIVRDGRTLKAHRVLVNNRQRAFLYEPNQARPSVALNGVELRSITGGFRISGTTDGGDPEVWEHKQVVRTAGGCGSCGGG